jgi:hypothetical protein
MPEWLSRFQIAATLVTIMMMPAATAQAQAPVRLRARTFVPAANVGLTGFSRMATRMDAPRRHVLVQFSTRISEAHLDAVRRLGAVPLRYVPENTLSLSAPVDFDASRVPDARWVGELEPADRTSGETAGDLARERPLHPLTVVEFHPDVSKDLIAETLAQAGTASIEPSSLPDHFAVIATEQEAVTRLAGMDSVAWIHPGTVDLLAPGAAVCEGLVQPEGIVASFAAMGDGWDGPGAGTARLGYVFSNLSADVDRLSQIREVERAMVEWSRYAAISWSATAGLADAGAVHITWAPIDHGDGFPFAPEVLAHAFYPAPPVPEPLAGDVHFNESFTWGTGDPSRFDIFSIALHELGHSLGLAHSGDPAAVMYPVYRGIVPGLSRTDIAGIRSLYAAVNDAAIPPGWQAGAIGGDVRGSVTAHDGTFTIEAAGRDIWDTADEFRFAWRTLAGDGDVIARVDALSGTHRWSKAGVMIRADDTPGAPHAFVLVSAARGLAFQRRRAANGTSVHTDGGPGTAPQWLWLSRRGSLLRAYAAIDGGEWRPIGSDAIALGTSVLAGIAVTNHDVAGTATAVFSNVTVTAVPQPAWSNADIGAVGRAGSTVVTAARVHLTGAGADIWNQADAFQFAWQTLDGDGEIVARVASVQFTKSWANAGVMIRDGTGPGAAHAFMLASAGKGFAFQRRVAADGITAHTSGGAGTAPGWLKLQRSGDRFNAFRSADGVTWTLVGTEIIPMGRQVLAGLAVSSHNATLLCEAVFDSVSVQKSAAAISF